MGYRPGAGSLRPGEIEGLPPRVSCGEPVPRLHQRGKPCGSLGHAVRQHTRHARLRSRAGCAGRDISGIRSRNLSQTSASRRTLKTLRKPRPRCSGSKSPAPRAGIFYEPGNSRKGRSLCSLCGPRARRVCAASSVAQVPVAAPLWTLRSPRNSFPSRLPGAVSSREGARSFCGC